MPLVTIDGPNRLIVVNAGIDSLDVKQDVYSYWKNWVLDSDNAKYPPAFRSTGGDPIGGGKFAGANFFIDTSVGWKLRPREADHELTLDGNLYPEDVTVPMLTPTLGGYTVAVILERSSLATAVGDLGDGQSVAQAIWGAEVANHNTSGTFGSFVQSKLLTFSKWLGLK